MDYRGIITKGYHIDSGGQGSVRIVSLGYIGSLAVIQAIIVNVERFVFTLLSQRWEFINNFEIFNFEYDNDRIVFKI